MRPFASLLFSCNGRGPQPVLRAGSRCRSVLEEVFGPHPASGFLLQWRDRAGRQAELSSRLHRFGRAVCATASGERIRGYTKGGNERSPFRSTDADNRQKLLAIGSRPVRHNSGTLLPAPMLKSIPRSGHCRGDHFVCDRKLAGTTLLAGPTESKRRRRRPLATRWIYFHTGRLEFQALDGRLSSRVQPTHDARPNFDYELTALRIGYMFDTPRGHGFFRGNDEFHVRGARVRFSSRDRGPRWAARASSTAAILSNPMPG